MLDVQVGDMTGARRVFLFFLLLVITAASSGWCQSSTDEMIKSAETAYAQGRLDEAIKLYEKANKASGQKCWKCYFKISFAKMNMGDEGGAKKMANKAIEVAQTAQERADANALKGEVLLNFAEENMKQVAEAEEAYRTAQKEKPEMGILYLRIGTCLAREGKDDEARKEFQLYLEKYPDSRDAALVKRWIENPARSKFTTAPDFTVTTLKGEEVSLEALHGRVVLLDFWGTWCPPCRASVPEIKELIKKYPPEKLVVVSISSDSDRQKWEQFVADNKMDWPQYLDSDAKIRMAYKVNSFPTYIVIDKDRCIRERLSGMDLQVTLKGRIGDVLKKLLAN